MAVAAHRRRASSASRKIAMKYALTIILASLLLSGEAHAERAMVVNVRGLNLHTRAGAFLAMQRMEDAAAAFCTAGSRKAPREADVTTLKCRRDMATRAASKLKSPEVSYIQSQFAPTAMLAAQSPRGTGAAGAL
jgi:UrcA family protein